MESNGRKVVGGIDNRMESKIPYNTIQMLPTADDLLMKWLLCTE